MTFPLVLIFSLCSPKPQLIVDKIKVFDYPSASAIDCINNTLFVMGDDTKELLLLDTSLNNLEKVSLFKRYEKRIPKP
ncbi:MAG: hypothetical protein N2747_08610 [Chitinophagaceae bacterium]|nr:hypothetical protein [Chitinophagaceae bacterium]